MYGFQRRDATRHNSRADFAGDPWPKRLASEMRTIFLATLIISATTRLGSAYVVKDTGGQNRIKTVVVERQVLACLVFDAFDAFDAQGPCLLAQPG